MAPETTTRTRTYTTTEDARRESPAYYRILAVLLFMGVVVATVLGMMGQTGPGWIQLEAAQMTLFAVVYLLTFVLFLFLLRIGQILDVDKRVQTVVTSAQDREESMRASYEQLQAEIVRLRQQLAPPPLGDVQHHVLEIEGIGPTYAARLNAIGIITVDQLLAANPDNVGPRIDATPGLVQEWQAMAQLTRLKGIGPQTAELLVRVGIRSPQELANAEPKALAARCRDAIEGRHVRITNQNVSPAVAKRWIEGARGSRAA